jgi:hypothetical protein
MNEMCLTIPWTSTEHSVNTTALQHSADGNLHVSVLTSTSKHLTHTNKNPHDSFRHHIIKLETKTPRRYHQQNNVVGHQNITPLPQDTNTKYVNLQPTEVFTNNTTTPIMDVCYTSSS